MNIAEILVMGATPSPTAASPTSTSDKATGDFNALLAGLAAQLSDTDQTSTASPNALIMRLLSPMVGTPNGPVTGLPAELEDLFKEFGDALLAAVTELLESGTAPDTNQDAMTHALDDIIASLLNKQDGTGANNTLVKLFVSVKERAAHGTLKDELTAIAEDLPEAIKLKLRLFGREKGNGAEPREMAMVQYKLIAGILGVAGPHDSVVAGDTKGSSLASIPNASAHEKLMVAIHTVPGTQIAQTGGKGAPLAVSTALADAEGAVAQAMGDPVAFANAAPEGSIEPVQVKQEVMTDIASGTASLEADGALSAVLPAEDQQAGTMIKAKESVSADASEASHEGLHRGSDQEKPSADNGAQAGLQKEGGAEYAKAEPNAELNGAHHAYRHTVEAKPHFAREMSQAAAAGTHEAAGKTSADNLIGQIVEKFDMLVADGRSEAKIQLRPRHLGELNIRLTIENGVMRAVIDASSHQVKEVLESNLATLKQSLQDQGLQVKEFSVSVGHHKENHGQEQGHGFKRYGRGRFSNMQAPAVQDVQRMRASINFGSEKIVNCLA